jgi:chromosome segregation ATPase
MKSIPSEILKKLKKAETQLESLSQELQSLESGKKTYLQGLVRGEQLFREVKETDQLLKEKKSAISKTRKEVGNLRARLAGQLAQFKRDLIEEKQRELRRHMKQRERYLKRIGKLEVEVSKYRYLVTGKKDRRLANVKDLLPSDLRHQDEFVPVDEAIGYITLEVHRINRMGSEALLKEYLAREKKQ